MAVFFFAYDIEEAKLRKTELQVLADLIVGSPIYVRKVDRKVVASVKQVIVKDSKTLLLHLSFLDPNLEAFVTGDDPHNDAEKYYFLIDCVECMLYDPH